MPLAEGMLARGIDRDAALHAGFAALALVSYATRSLYLGAAPDMLALLTGIVALPLAAVSLARRPLRIRLWQRCTAAQSCWAVFFAADLALYALAGLGMFVLHALYVPEASGSAGAGLRLAVGALLLGYFAALDMALSGPVAHRPQWGFGRVGIFTAGVAIACAALAVYDHLWRLFAHGPGGSALVEPQLFLVDAAVLSLPPLVLAARAGQSYARGLQQDLRRRIALFEHPDEDARAREDASEDEDTFSGLLKRIRAGLRDKERVLQALERSVGAEVMQTLLTERPRDTPPDTRAHEVVILYCDLRNFTSFAEYAPPEEVLFLLNSYFSRVVAIIGEHGGMVNKFLGDAVLAIFGLDDMEPAPAQAVRAARAIRAHVEAHQEAGYTRLDNGISLHAGEAVAGRLGSPERYEYTFVGETVNTAMRLDGLTKRLGVHLVLSEAVHARLPGDMRIQFRDLGEHRLRGSGESVRVYGPAPGSE